MKLWNIGSALRCGALATGVMITGLTVAADDLKSENKHDKTASKEHAQGPMDAATCIKEAAKMNMATIRFGQLATQKAENSELKRFAQTLERDHRQAQADLETIAKKHNVTLPTSLEAKCEEEISRLEAKSGHEFDREFAKGAVEGHAMAMSHLQHASTQAKDPDLRQHIDKMLAKVKEHQREGRQVAMAVGVDQATISSLERKAQEGVGGPAGSEKQTSQNNDSSKRSEESKK